MTDQDYHLSTFCDPALGGCGAVPGENCRPGCVTLNDDAEVDLADHIDEVDPDQRRDWVIDRELGVI